MSGKEHWKALERMLEELPAIGEDEHMINWLVCEPRWYAYGYEEEYKLCDVLIKYRDGTGGAVELKKSPAGSRKGRLQLRNGKRFLHNEFGIEQVRMKLVYYEHLPVWEYVPLYR